MIRIIVDHVGMSFCERIIETVTSLLAMLTVGGLGEVPGTLPPNS